MMCVHREMLVLVDLSKHRPDVNGEKLLPEPYLRIQGVTRDSDETTEAYCLDSQGKLSILSLRVI